MPKIQKHNFSISGSTCIDFLVVLDFLERHWQVITTNNMIFGCIWMRLKTGIPNLWQLLLLLLLLPFFRRFWASHQTLPPWLVRQWAKWIGAANSVRRFHNWCKKDCLHLHRNRSKPRDLTYILLQLGILTWPKGHGFLLNYFRCRRLVQSALLEKSSALQLVN